MYDFVCYSSKKQKIKKYWKKRKLQHQLNNIGFNLEQVTYNGLEFGVWDVGGQLSITTVTTLQDQKKDKMYSKKRKFFFLLR
ncbi:hypothetical protein RFI_30408 [Reticulomyxa filosa]|uniref:Uncharacterized protein n=1 Tax=Reticulomyxa filosa TaxID=46433 RepID=X6LZF1_RETFI|nr:hypothetical protein RFI_30408 [Reticulomyxa filosa]|eukprot:ETO06984.1 hypothetical protein RFI_30408 [Reticulomyxa filosa]